MLVVGTPRPSSSILGEVADNGFFEQSSNSEDEAFDLDNLWGGDIPVDARGIRTRSESFHEMFDEKAKSSPIVLEGNQPLLTRQLNIVTMLASNNNNNHNCIIKPWGNRIPEEIAEEEALEKEEHNLLERWRGIGGKGRPDAISTDSSRSRKSKKRTHSLQSALVPAAVVGLALEGNVELLPRYEEKVQILVFCNTIPGTCPKIEWKTTDFSDAGGRRVHCQIWEYHPCLQTAELSDDAIIEMYIKGSDAIVANCGYSEFNYKWLTYAISIDRVVVITNSYGSSISEAKKYSHTLGAHLDVKGTSWIEIAARDVVLRSAKARGERKSVLITMEKQLRKTEKKKGGACIVM